MATVTVSAIGAGVSGASLTSMSPVPPGPNNIGKLVRLSIYMTSKTPTITSITGAVYFLAGRSGPNNQIAVYIKNGENPEPTPTINIGGTTGQMSAQISVLSASGGTFLTIAAPGDGVLKAAGGDITSGLTEMWYGIDTQNAIGGGFIEYYGMRATSGAGWSFSSVDVSSGFVTSGNAVKVSGAANIVGSSQLKTAASVAGAPYQVYVETINTNGSSGAGAQLVIEYATVASGISRAVGMATQVNTALPLARRKAKAPDAVANEFMSPTLSGIPFRKSRPWVVTPETDSAFSRYIPGSSRSVGVSIATNVALPAGGRVKKRAPAFATESSAALVVTRAKVRTPSPCIQANSAFALGRVKYRVDGISIAADSALALSRKGSRQAGLSIESSTALPLTVRVQRAIGVAVSSNSAFPLVRSGIHGMVLASETDAGFAFARRKSKATAVATETSAPFILSRLKRRACGISTQSNTALPLSIASIGTYGISVNSDQSLALTGVKKYPITLATSSNTAFAIPRAFIRTIVMASETDTAVFVRVHAAKLIVPALESDSAFRLELFRRATRAEETDTAITRQAIKRRSVVLAAETDTPFTFSRSRTYPVGRATEITTAPFTFVMMKQRATQPAFETEAAVVVQRVKAKLPVLALETNTAFMRTPFHSNAPNASVEFGEALVLHRIKYNGVVGQAIAPENDRAFALSNKTNKFNPFGPVHMKSRTYPRSQRK